MNPAMAAGNGFGASEIRAHLQSGGLTSESLMTRLVERIGRYEPQVRAWEWLDAERALSLARESDALYAAGRAGPLQGIPLGIKDVIETAGIPTRMGSPLFADHVPARSAAVIRALEDAGAIVLGKTVTTEFATQCPGKTRNPWNPAHTPGGSSSGSAAAVAAGFVPAAVGTQTRGSTIRPAAYCGVVGYKPSLGAISTEGIFPTSGTLDQVGFFGMSVADVALLTAACLPSRTRIQPVPSAPPALALARTVFWNEASPEQQRCVEAAARHFAALGATVDRIDLPAPFDRASWVCSTIQRYEIVQLHRDKLEDWKPSLSRQFLAYVEAGRQIGAAQYQEALELRKELAALYDDLARPYGAVLSPPADGEAPLGLEATGSANFCATWTICGVPALTLPAGLGPRRLPLGIQLTGLHGRDASFLESARWCESALRVWRESLF